MTQLAPDRESGHDGCTDTELDARDVRALTERMGVLDDVGPARGADGIFRVVSQSGSTYTVDLQLGACSCPDSERRDPAGGCKHVRRAAFATGERGVPAWVDADAVDAMLGAHVAAGPKVLATDGGILEPGDDGEILDGDEGDGDDARPDDCDCGDWNADAELPCWPCYRDGFNTPASAE